MMVLSLVSVSVGEDWWSGDRSLIVWRLVYLCILSYFPTNTIEFNYQHFEILLILLLHHKINSHLSISYPSPSSSLDQSIFFFLYIIFYYYQQTRMEANINSGNRQLQYSLRGQYLGTKINVIGSDSIPQTMIQSNNRRSLYSSSLFNDRAIGEVSVAVRKRERQSDTLSVREEGVHRRLTQKGYVVKRKESQNGKEKGVGHDYNQQLIRLKIEQMTFKFKTKVGSLLKQMDISVNQLDKFTAFSRIDQILDFLAEKVRDKLIKRQIIQISDGKAKDKQRELLVQYETQIETMRIKKNQREGIEKGYKIKLKQAHHQIRQLYDRVNQKERQLSLKMTEMYQMKSIQKESQKIIENYKQKCILLQKQNSDLSQRKNQQQNKLLAKFNLIQEQNTQLKEKIQDLNDLIQQMQSKQMQIVQSNQQLSEELQRWRERFQSPVRNAKIQPIQVSQQIIKEKRSEENSQRRSLKGRLSILTLQSQNQMLNYKSKQLEKQNRQLVRELEGYLSLKQKYEGLVSSMSVSHEPQQSPSHIQPSQHIFSPSPLSLGQKWKSILGQSSCFQIEVFYRKQIESIIQQWRDKLYEIVSKYEQDQENNKKEIADLSRNNEQLQSKVYKLANQKYLIENKLIDKERELYQLVKTNKSGGSSRQKLNTETQSKSGTVSGNERRGSESVSQNGISK